MWCRINFLNQEPYFVKSHKIRPETSRSFDTCINNDEVIADTGLTMYSIQADTGPTLVMILSMENSLKLKKND